MDLDRIDRDILSLLAKDARRTNKELAEEVGLSQSACLERVRRLTEKGALRGAHAEVDPAAFGIGLQALVAIQLERHTRAAVVRFEEKAIALSQVVALYHTTGRNDYIAHAVAQDMEHLRDFTLDAITSLPDVGRVETSLVFRATHKSAWPDLT
ncbi:MAG: Lrp/AsnC family transcriptional regulator, partial [Longimicrobiales bacterium]|nr:Lrp/AsnC family transcriptional regulator [Longimicrobiales bacterium]